VWSRPKKISADISWILVADCLIRLEQEQDGCNKRASQGRRWPDLSEKGRPTYDALPVSPDSIDANTKSLDADIVLLLLLFRLLVEHLLRMEKSLTRVEIVESHFSFKLAWAKSLKVGMKESSK
jgi:hypothetical protein